MAMPGRGAAVAGAAETPRFEAKKDRVVDHTVAVGRAEEEEDDEEEEEWQYEDESNIYLRSKFFESWLWKTVDLPAQADRDG